MNIAKTILIPFPITVVAFAGNNAFVAPSDLALFQLALTGVANPVFHFR
jgi:hypothetical protein